MILNCIHLKLEHGIWDESNDIESHMPNKLEHEIWDEVRKKNIVSFSNQIVDGWSNVFGLYYRPIAIW